MLSKAKSRSLSGKTKLLIFLFLAGSIIPNFLFAQFTQQGPKLVGTGAVGNYSWQGSSVAISSDGNTAIVGGEFDNNQAGAGWIFVRSGGVWTQQGPKLVGTGAVGNASQGRSVAISSDGNTAIVGGYRDNATAGAIWVFTRNGGIWTQQGPKLVGTDAIGSDVEQGFSVAISSDGNTAIVGGWVDNSGSGAVWVFTRSGGVWTQQGPKLIGSGAVGHAFQGSSVAISSDDNTVIVGGYYDNTGMGAIWVFTRNGSVWTQQGSKLVGTGAVGNAWEGYSVAISSDGNTTIVGGTEDNNLAGAVWIFTRSGGVWTQQGPKLIGTGAIGNARQGYSVAISSDGNTGIVGGYVDNNFTGAVWVFTRSGNIWTQQSLKLVGTGAIGNAWQGNAVTLSSEGTLIEGGYEDNGGAGAVWVFYNPTLGITPISGNVPKDFSLLQNYPNPFNPSTKIRFEVPNKGLQPLVQIRVFDVLGREVSTLVNEQLQPGTYEVNFDATNFPGGVYFYKLTSNDFSETKKMVLIK
jgi:hypothetical protein